jgi:hypothetical protein
LAISASSASSASSAISAPSTFTSGFYTVHIPKEFQSWVNTPVIKFYHTLKDCDRDNPNARLRIAYDYRESVDPLKDPPKQFLTFNDYPDLFYWIVGLAKHRCYYEVITADQPQRLRFDLDISLDNYQLFHNDPVDLDVLAWSILQLVRLAIVQVFQTHYDIAYDPRWLYIKASHGPTKRSFHIIPHRYHASHANEAKWFYEQVIDTCIQLSHSRDVLTQISEAEWKTYLDHRVYKNNQFFRLLHCSKRGQDRYSSFSRLYDCPTGDIIEFQPAVDETDAIQPLLEFQWSLLTSVADSQVLPDKNPQMMTPDHNIPMDELGLSRGFQIWIDRHPEMTGIYHPLTPDMFHGRPRMYLRRQRSMVCPLCHRTHDSNNAEIYMDHYGHIWWKCLADGKRELLIEGHLPDPDDDLDSNRACEDPSGISTIAQNFTGPINHDLIASIFQKSLINSSFRSPKSDPPTTSFMPTPTMMSIPPDLPMPLPDHSIPNPSDKLVIPNSIPIQPPDPWARINVPILDKWDWQTYPFYVIRSPPGTAKTQNLVKAIQEMSPNASILILTFRVSQLQKALADLANLSLNFKCYTDKSVQHQGRISYLRLICQIDSLWRVRGHFDYIILDEIEYILQHLINFPRNKIPIWDALIDYLQHANGIYVSDALLSNFTVSLISRLSGRPLDQWKLVRNEYLKYNNSTVYQIATSTHLLKFINEMIGARRRVVVPTNSNTFAQKLRALINLNHPTCRIRLYSSEEPPIDDPVKEWNQYDLVIYTPTIVAGNSFTEEHFDLCCAYFSASSACAEMALQQLFRVRNLKLKQYYICIKNLGKKYSHLPPKITRLNASIKDVKDWIDYCYHYKLSDLSLGKKNDGLEQTLELIVSFKLDRVNDRLNFDNPFFDLYAYIYHRQARSRRYYAPQLNRLLKELGANCEWMETGEINLSSIKEQIKSITSELKEAQLRWIANAPVITPEEATQIRENPNATPEERVSLKKYNFMIQLHIPVPSSALGDPNAPQPHCNIELYKKYLDKRSHHRNLQILLSLRGQPRDVQDDFLAQLPTLMIPKDVPLPEELKIPSNSSMYRDIQEFITKDDWVTRSRQLLNGIKILRHFGFSDPFDSSEQVINFKDPIHTTFLIGLGDEFVITHDKNPTLSKRLNPVPDKVNPVLSKLFSIKISRPSSRRGNTFILAGLDQWTIQHSIITPSIISNSDTASRFSTLISSITPNFSIITIPVLSSPP